MRYFPRARISIELRPERTFSHRYGLRPDFAFRSRVTSVTGFSVTRRPRRDRSSVLDLDNRATIGPLLLHKLVKSGPPAPGNNPGDR
jgi:hypothetical protein